MGFMNSIAAASMTMSEARVNMAYDTAMVKKSMDAMEEQAAAMIDMIQSAAPSPYKFDVYA